MRVENKTFHDYDQYFAKEVREPIEALQANLDVHGHPAIAKTHAPNFLATSFDPALAGTGGASPGAGFGVVVRMYLRDAATISNIHMYVNTAGDTLTAGQNFAGLYQVSGSSLVRLAQTADQTTAWGGTGEMAMALTSPVSGTADTVYYVVFLANGTATPAFSKQTSHASVNFGNASSPYRFSFIAGGGLTALPSSVLLANITADTAPWLVALS